MKIFVHKPDDILYLEIMQFLGEVKLLQGGDGLIATLRRHKGLKNFLIDKQKEHVEFFETTYFNSDGSLDYDVLDSLKDL